VCGELSISKRCVQGLVHDQRRRVERNYEALVASAGAFVEEPCGDQLVGRAIGKEIDCRKVNHPCAGRWKLLKLCHTELGCVGAFCESLPRRLQAVCSRLWC